MLRIAGLSYGIGGRRLFEGAAYTLGRGRKAGLVGRNGSGKTTLFRLIGGEAAPEAGEIRLNGARRIGRVAQEAPNGPESLLETVLSADEERAALLAEAETARDPGRIAEVHIRLADMGAEAAPARAAAILAGLGFDEEAQSQSCAQLSGGWRMRVALAAALFARPDLLLLDEPTNHLDLEAAIWLEGHLAKWPGTLLLISHERDLLNRAVDEIVHLEDTRLTRYVGGYDNFEKTRGARLDQEVRTRRRQAAERQRIERFVERFRYKATKARQAQSRIKMLARMAPIASVVEEKTASFAFLEPDILPPPLIALDRASAGYDGAPAVLAGLDLRIDMDDRIALIGANGNGKSTLVKLLAGRLEPLAGRVTRARKLKIAYFAQHQAEELDPDASPFTHLLHAAPKETDTRLRAHLGRFGFPQARADTRAGDLSGGEKARLIFALMSWDAPHLLLLDEPTNHLDVDARAALIQALNAYSGAVVLVSHDSHLVNLVADRLWRVAMGTCHPFDGDLADYQRLLTEERRDGKSAGNEQENTQKTRRRDRAQRRAEIAPLRQAARAAAARVQEIEAARAALEAKLADGATYAGRASEITALKKELGWLAHEQKAAEADWLAAEEALEAAGAGN